MERKEKIAEFQNELEKLINRLNMESVFGDTPDFILAAYAVGFLEWLGDSVARRASWFGSNVHENKVLDGEVTPNGEGGKG